jgi:phosphohistidine swiveling domain-containing protein
LSFTDAQTFDPTEAWDPIHTYTAPGDYWTRGNVGEAIPGVQTPLSWTMWARAADLCLREGSFATGAITSAERQIPARPEERAVRIFYGRAAMQIDFIVKLGDRMPGTSGEEAVASLYGHVPPDLAFHPTIRRYPIIAWRLPRASVTISRRCRRFATATDAWYRASLPKIADADIHTTKQILTDAGTRFPEAVVLQTIALLAAVQPLYEALVRLTAKAGVADVAVLSGTGGAEMQIVGDLWRAAHGRLTIAQVATRHGYHGPLEGELSSRVWREDQTPIAALVDLYRDRPDPSATDHTAKLSAMQRELLAAVPRIQRPIAKVILTLAPRTIPLRGVVKVSFLEAFDIARAAARRHGELLAERALLQNPDDVFFLTYDELVGPTLPKDTSDLVLRRKERHAEYAKLELPGTFTGMPTPIIVTGPSDGTRITGVGVSTGVVEGIAHVVEDPSFAEIEPDRVLVARATDPSWCSIMFISSALVCDIGGAMSHAAVVAREMGIPCVVGTESGTRTIRTGDRVRVDGTSGVVEIVSRA